MKEDAKNDPRTVFVRGVSYSTTDAEFAEFFGSVGPTKQAFLVKEGKQSGHKGFGFVQYALEEDAERALKELQGATLAGKKLKVEGALKRASLEERKKRKRPAAKDEKVQQQDDKSDDDDEEEEQKPPEKPVEKPIEKKSRGSKPKPEVKDPNKHASVRTVAIGGITSTKALDAALKRAETCGKVEIVVKKTDIETVQRYKLTQDGCTGVVALVTFSTVKEVFAAVAALHGQPVLPGAKSGGRLWARQLSGEGLHIKRWRLVIRNLSFKATEQDLRDAFSPAGFVWDIALPRAADGTGKGFAFVGFQCKADAERGIKLVNATKIANRPVAVDWALSKREYEEVAATTKGNKKLAAAGGNRAPESDSEAAGLSESDDDDDDDEAHQALAGANKKRRVPGQDTNDGDVDNEIGAEDERKMLHGVLDGILGEDDDENKPDMLSKSALAEASKGKKSAAVERLEAQQRKVEAKLAHSAAKQSSMFDADHDKDTTDCTVFIRGLALDTVKDQVFTAMKAFGYVRSCRLVINKETGKSKGTAFVEFRDKDSAQAAADMCAKGRAGEGPGVLIAGRKVECDVALGGEDIRKLAVQKADESGKGRGRMNRELAKEGIIAEGTPAWEDMSEADREKRKRAQEEARTKLRSPNFAVSATRLSIRNIPRNWNEKQLKQLFIKAVKERASKSNPKVVQAKVLVGDNENGEKRSKGIGFIEFSNHDDALCALRQLNNNPQAWGADRRPIVEFAIDDVRILQQRNARKAAKENGAGRVENPAETRSQTAGDTKKGRPSRDADIEDEDDGAPKSKRKLRKERRLMLKELAKEQAGDGSDGGGDGSASKKNKSKRRRAQRHSGKKAPDAAVEAKKPVVVSNKQPAAAAKSKKAVVEAKPATHSKATGADNKKKRKASQDNNVPGTGKDAKPKKVKKGDKLDALVDNYMKKFIGGGEAKKAKPTKPAAGNGDLKRWFD